MKTTTKNTAAEKLDVSTHEYRSSHGREPRGRGSWAFIFDGAENDVFWTPPLSYAQARKLALVEAHRRGARSIKVGS